MKGLEGTVISVGMQKTIVVEVVRKVPHKLYKKLLKRSKKYKVDSSGKEIVVGDKVRFVPTRPMGAQKHFKVAEVLGKKEK